MTNKKTSLKILVVEDGAVDAMALVKALEQRGHYVQAVRSAKGALQVLSTHQFDFSFLDIDLEEREKGFSVLKELKSKKIFTVILSGHESMDYIEKAYNLECDDYLVKPFSVSKIDYALSKFYLQSTKQKFQKLVSKYFYTVEPSVQAEVLKLEKSLFSKLSISINGPTGVGKGVLAKVYHLAKYGSLDKFVHINCSAIPENLIETELFGSLEGAFSGATKREGKITEANKGTLYLDEIGTMSKSLQEKLLVVLESKKVIPVGGGLKDEKTVDFSLITSTCEDLKEKIEEGKFREDLYYRISGQIVEIPSLKNRTEDVKMLVDFEIEKLKTIRAFAIAPGAKEILNNYTWPGNVRELISFFQSIENLNKPILTIEKLPGKMKDPKFQKLGPVEEQKTLGHKEIQLIEKVGYSNFRFHQETQAVEYYMKKFDGNKSKVREFLGNMTHYSLKKHMGGEKIERKKSRN